MENDCSERRNGEMSSKVIWKTTAQKEEMVR